MPESACREKSESSNLRFEDLPFSSIPGQSKLFLGYISTPKSLRKYYPNAMESFAELKGNLEKVLTSYSVDREAVCDVLDAQNREFGSSDKTFKNITKLRDGDCVAVLTGQQVGLFTGPLYTIYKALSAIRCAETLSKAGVKAVPIFWMATKDHDFEEISRTFAYGGNAELIEARIASPESESGRPVGNIDLNDSIGPIISDWIAQFPDRDGTAGLKNLLESSYSSGSGLGLAFGRLLAKLLAKTGIIIFGPDKTAEKLTSPLIFNAAKNADVIVDAFRQRSSELIVKGYHAQVLVEENYFPFFWIGGDGKRISIKRRGENKLRITGSNADIDIETLIADVKNGTGSLCPGVILRPVVQDYLFPTICYVGGAAEIAYFAQNSVAYQVLQRPVTPIFHRQSFTIVEPKHLRTMEKYGLKFEDVFRGFDALLPEIIGRVIDPETPQVFDDVNEKINTELDRLDQQLSKIDLTLVEGLAKRRRKIIYHLESMWKKASRARIEKDEFANRRLRSLFTSLYPNNGLQERTLNVAAFANTYGLQFIDWIYNSTDVENKEHRVIYL